MNKNTTEHAVGNASAAVDFNGVPGQSGRTSRSYWTFRSTEPLAVCLAQPQPDSTIN
jgi:hypothetical protein